MKQPRKWEGDMDAGKSMEEIFGPVIYSYTRAQALEDGVLVDVSKMAREAGFIRHTAVTAAVWAMINDIPTKGYGDWGDVQGRLWDVLWMAKCAARLQTLACNRPEISFAVILPTAGSRKRKVMLKGHCGPGDDGEAVITIMMPQED